MLLLRDAEIQRGAFKRSLSINRVIFRDPFNSHVLQNTAMSFLAEYVFHRLLIVLVRSVEQGVGAGRPADGDSAHLHQKYTRL